MGRILRRTIERCPKTKLPIVRETCLECPNKSKSWTYDIKDGTYKFAVQCTYPDEKERRP